VSWLDEVPWNEHGLIAAIVQDSSSDRILTLAWMNREALQQTVETRQAL
jgi:phosphoribosyl-AMP cyclohydrolase